jgi:hypothetical protein
MKFRQFIQKQDPVVGETDFARSRLTGSPRLGKGQIGRTRPAEGEVDTFFQEFAPRTDP